MATLVERKTRYLILAALPGSRTAEALNNAIAAQLEAFPPTLRRTLTWDQGKETAGHKTLREKAGIEVYLCDPVQSLAARNQREHQRAAPPVFPQVNQLLQARPESVRPGSSRTKQPTTPDPRLANTPPSINSRNQTNILNTPMPTALVIETTHDHKEPPRRYCDETLL